MAKEHQVLPGYVLGLLEMKELTDLGYPQVSGLEVRDVWDIVNSVLMRRVLAAYEG